MAVNPNGFVHLVGAGPGDPELLTVKAMRLIQQADVLVYDRLVSTDILALVPEGTERIYVGKSSGQHSLPQEEINALLVSLAQAGRRVVRLKGGDPYIFGRGSEEALHLIANGIGFEAVPGITSAAGCGASAGIPLTHRGLAHGVRFVTGHCRAGDDLDLNWDSLADPDTTLVIYMGTANAEVISQKLIAAGLAADTPTAAISNGTLPNQRTMLTTLAALPMDLAAQGFKPPTLIIVGKVVSLAPELSVSPAPETMSHA
jgi:uroporphyrin-III C-methyltransferase/precorrin-2 dehydrogenase/sirohydrochlorin ferrochelatase/uroporphyrin-III C-methyltransferase